MCVYVWERDVAQGEPANNEYKLGNSIRLTRRGNKQQQQQRKQQQQYEKQISKVGTWLVDILQKMQGTLRALNIPHYSRLQGMFVCVGASNCFGNYS